MPVGGGVDLQRRCVGQIQRMLKVRDNNRATTRPGDNTPEGEKFTHRDTQAQSEIHKNRQQSSAADSRLQSNFTVQWGCFHFTRTVSASWRQPYCRKSVPKHCIWSAAWLLILPCKVGLIYVPAAERTKVIQMPKRKENERRWIQLKDLNEAYGK